MNWHSNTPAPSRRSVRRQTGVDTKLCYHTPCSQKLPKTKNVKRGQGGTLCASRSVACSCADPAAFNTGQALLIHWKSLGVTPTSACVVDKIYCRESSCARPRTRPDRTP